MTSFNDYMCLLDNIDNNPLYLEKRMMDDEMVCADVPKRVCNHYRDCSWIRNRKHKKKLISRFLSLNPTMDYTHFYGCRPEEGWYFCTDSKGEYDINPFSHVYLSQRGDIRVLHGTILSFDKAFFLSSRKEIKTRARATNRKIRHAKINEDMSLQYSFYKKQALKLWEKSL